MAKKRYKKEQIIEALQQSHGLKTGACEILGCNFDTLQRYIAEIPESADIIAHWRKRRTERAMYKLDEAIEKGEAWAIALQLKNSKDGRDEGYSERVDVTSNGETVRPSIIEVIKTNE